MTNRNYTQLMKFETFEERFEYLRLRGTIGKETFGEDRQLNQWFYKTYDWLAVRDYVINRDYGYDLGSNLHPISGPITVHHMNPITIQDVLDRNPDILNPEYLISTSDDTHKGLHYNTKQFMKRPFVERMPDDTSPWKNTKGETT